MAVMTKDVVTIDDALDWIVGYCMRRPMTRAAILCQTAEEGRTWFAEPLANTFGACYQASRRKIEFENKSTIQLYDAGNPDLLRGPRFDVGLIQERVEHTPAEENLHYAVRTGSYPRIKYVRT